MNDDTAKPVRARRQPADGHVVIGELGRPHGIVGEMRAYPTGPTFEGLAAGTPVVAHLRSGERRPLTLESVRPGAEALIVRFREAETREAAVELVGGLVEIPQSELPTISDPEEFYVRDLIGCSVVLSPSGAPLGTITEVHSGSANDSFSVTAEDGEVVLVPFTHDAIVEMDMTARLMAVREDLFGGRDS